MGVQWTSVEGKVAFWPVRSDGSLGELVVTTLPTNRPESFRLMKSVMSRQEYQKTKPTSLVDILRQEIESARRSGAQGASAPLRGSFTFLRSFLLAFQLLFDF